MKTKIDLRILFFLLVLIITKTNIFGQGGTSYVISNSDITVVCDAWLVDPDSLRGNYPVGITTMVIRTEPGRKLGIQLDSFSLREDGDYINIHDGASASSPLLSSLKKGCTPSCNLFDYGVKSSGAVVTIVFRGFGPGTPSAFAAGWRLRIRCIQDITRTADFLPVQQDVNFGNIQLNDYDKDGDKDVLMGGHVYRNDSRDDSLYVFDRITRPIGNWRNSTMVAADFDNDGWKDVFITGETDAGGFFTRRTLIFRNVNGSFTAGSTSTFTAATLGAVSTADFNNDGRIDIAYSGFTGTAYIFRIYINNGGFNFTEQATNLPGMIEASMAWSDYDNDGDLDLLYNGTTPSTQPATGLYINSNFTFTNASLIMLTSNNGKISWVDINKDGKDDIFNSGRSSTGSPFTPEILLNNGNTTFTRVITNLPNRFNTNYDWADYDKDGDMDIALTGFLLSGSGAMQDAAIYKYIGNGNFTLLTAGGGITSLSNPKWVDFNKDGTLDIVITGSQSAPSYFYKNVGNDSFQISSYPFTAYAGIGTTLVEDFSNDGFVDVLLAGNIDDQNCEEGNRSMLIKSLGWRIFPRIVLTSVVNLNVYFQGTAPKRRFWRWGDVNSDGKDDIIVTDNQDFPQTSIDSIRFFRNNGNHSFSHLYSGNEYHNQVGVVDINNDGINEIYGVPNALYRWNGTGLTRIYSELDGYCSSNGCNRMFFDFADFNNDGLVDVAYAASGILKIMRNNGVQFSTVQTFALSDQKFLRWADYDHDGDMDLLASSYSSSIIYENTNYGGFRVRDIDMPPHLHTGIADFNKDGWVDIFAFQYVSFIGPAKLFYNQQGKLFFQDRTPSTGFIEISSGGGATDEGAEAFDIDNDGDNDLIYATSFTCSGSGFYLNNNNIRNPGIIIRSPNGGNNYAIGSTQLIKWIGNDITGTVKIELSLDSGFTWNPIATNAASSKYSGQYQWTINTTSISNKCLIRITDNANNNILDVSDKTFIISTITAVNSTTIQNTIKIYPNPIIGDFFNFESNSQLSGKKVAIQIFDINGILVDVKSFVAQKGSNKINIRNLTTGMYMLKVSVEKEMASTYKIIKL